MAERKAPTDAEVTAFVTGVCRRAGIGIINFNGSIGLVHTPGKYVAVIDALHQAIASVARGDGLPELVPMEDVSAKKRRKDGGKP